MARPGEDLAQGTQWIALSLEMPADFLFGSRKNSFRGHC
jgi:hypothetical protein